MSRRSQLLLPATVHDTPRPVPLGRYSHHRVRRFTVRRETLTDGRNNVSIMEYDGFDRLVKLRYPNATGGGTSTTDYEAWTWNAAGQPNSARNRAGATTYFGWDLLGRMTDVAPPTGTPGTTAGFDNLGRQTSISTVPSSITVNTAYDPLSRPVSQSTTGLGAMLYTRDAAGRMTRIEWPDGFRAEYAHDVTGAVTGIDQHVPPAAATGLATYGYDNLGQLTGVTRNGGSGAATSYGYDAHARLTSLAQNPDGTTNDVTLGFSYNPAGQITGRTVGNDAYVYTLGSFGEDYYRNGLNQITAINAAPVTYDGNRNATAVNGNAYGYDAAGRLTSATPSGGSAAAFVFDPQGRLASSTVGATTTRYQYAGAQLAAEYDASGTVTRRYVPGLGLDSVVTAYTGSGVGTRDWLLADERGSVMALTGSTGAVSTINRYDEYGTPAPGNAGRFGYTGQAWLAEAAAWHYRARTYLPQIGRFLQPDPIGYQAGSNLYAYVGMDPVNAVDPMGLQSRQSGGTIRRDLCVRPVGEIVVVRGKEHCQLLDSSVPYSTEVRGDVPSDAGEGSSATAQNCTSGYNFLVSDFASLSGSIAIPNPYTGPFLGVGGTLTADRYGNSYASANLVAGFPSAISLSGMTGWMNGSGIPSEAELSGMLLGWGAGVSGGYILGGGFYGNLSGTAPMGGLTTPGASAYGGYTWKLPFRLPPACSG